jgi:hypothetical protein
MFRAKPILGFLGRFVMVFALLTAPWPGWPEVYARCLRNCATAIFGSFGSRGIVEFAPNPAGGNTVDTIIYVSNRERRGANPAEPKASHEFDSRIGAYYPTALVMALVLATRINWRRRFAAFGWGLVWVHVFIAFLLGLIIVSTICDRPSLGLFTVSPFWQKTVAFWYEIFIALLGGRFAAAVLIWILVTFKRDDWSNLLGIEGARAGQPAR